MPSNWLGLEDHMRMPGIEPRSPMHVQAKYST